MKTLALIALTALALVGCAKSEDSKKDDSKTKTQATQASMSGVWKFTPTILADYVDYHPTVGSDFSYIEIVGSDVTLISAGNPDKGETELQSKFELRMVSAKRGELRLPQALIEKARKAGASEAELEQAQKNPCTLEATTADKMLLSCPLANRDLIDSIKVDLTRTTTEVLEAGRAEMRNLARDIEAHTNTLIAALGGKSFRLTEIYNYFGEEGQKPTEYTMLGEDQQEETGTGKDLYITPKLVQFSTDLKTARINGKHLANVTVSLLKDGGAKISVDLPKGVSSTLNMFSGKLELKDGGFSTEGDMKLKKMRFKGKKTFVPAQ